MKNKKIKILVVSFVLVAVWGIISPKTVFAQAVPGQNKPFGGMHLNPRDEYPFPCWCSLSWLIKLDVRTAGSPEFLIFNPTRSIAYLFRQHLSHGAWLLGNTAKPDEYCVYGFRCERRKGPYPVISIVGTSVVP